MNRQKPRVWSVVGVFLVVVLCLELASCGRFSPAREEWGQASSILLVLIDTLRADHLGTYGYIRDTSPNLDALAEQSVVFERAMTPMATTLPAHVSIMTSTHPARHGVVKNGLRFEPGPGLVPFASLMRQRGYETAAFVSAKPLALETGVGTGFDHFDQPNRSSRRGERTVEEFFAWLEGRGAQETPFFVWIHLWDPHAPYDPPGEYASLFQADDELRRHLAERKVPLAAPSTGPGREWDPQDLYNAYDGEVRYVDAQLGRILGRLDEEGLYEDLALVVVADHGEGLLQHGWLDHGQIYDEELWVPMMIKPPRGHPVGPRRVGGVASTLDVVPTLAGLLSLDFGDEARAQFMGVDRLGSAAEARRYVLSERVHRYRRGWEPGDKAALTGSRWRVYVLSKGQNRLFDLQQDPHELENVRGSHLELAGRLEQALTDRLSTCRGEASTARMALGDKHRKSLKALGYLD